MKAIASVLIGFVLVASMVSATLSDTLENIDTMAMEDAQVVQYCVDDGNLGLEYSIVVDPLCRDQNAIPGCQDGDEYDPAGFTVTPLASSIVSNGCVDLLVETDLDVGGVFWYTVNGNIGSSTVVSETDDILVPEFGVLASIGILGAAGLYIFKRRQ